MALNRFVPLIILLITVCFGPSSVLSAKCADAEVFECVSDLGTLKYNDTEKVCESLNGMISCLVNVEKSCELSEYQRNSKEQVWQQIQNIMTMCLVKNDGCYSKASECMAPFEKKYNKTKAASEICPVMDKTSTCLKNLVSGCENKEMKQKLVMSIHGVTLEGKRLNCKDAGYTITDLDGKGVALQPTVAIFLSASLIAFMLL